MRGPTQCHRLLGVGASTYAAYKAGKLPMPECVRLHAELLIRIPAELLLTIEKERLA